MAKRSSSPAARWSTQTGIEGGVSHHLTKGDVITIPAKTPHQWKDTSKNRLGRLLRGELRQQLTRRPPWAAFSAADRRNQRARRKDDAPANGTRSLGFLTLRFRCEHRALHGGGLGVRGDVVRQDQYGHLAITHESRVTVVNEVRVSATWVRNLSTNSIVISGRRLTSSGARYGIAVKTPVRSSTPPSSDTSFRSPKKRKSAI
jgi:hypothetical protein